MNAMLMDALVEAIAAQVVEKVKAAISSDGLKNLQPALLTVKEAGVYLGRSEQAVQHLIFQKELPVIRVGRRVHLARKDLDKWIEQNKS